MGLNIKNPKVEALAAEVARLTGENKTDAIRHALEERRARLVAKPPGDAREAALGRVLEREIWPKVPKNVRGTRISKEEREEILGYGPGGA